MRSVCGNKHTTSRHSSQSPYHPSHSAIPMAMPTSTASHRNYSALRSSRIHMLRRHWFGTCHGHAGPSFARPSNLRSSLSEPRSTVANTERNIFVIRGAVRAISFSTSHFLCCDKILHQPRWGALAAGELSPERITAAATHRLASGARYPPRMHAHGLCKTSEICASKTLSGLCAVVYRSFCWVHVIRAICLMHHPGCIAQRPAGRIDNSSH